MTDGSFPARVLEPDPTDLVDLTAALVEVPSVSRGEEALATAIERRIRARAPQLAVERRGNNVVARTEAGRERRIVLAGHLDTVPPAGDGRAGRRGDEVHGLGSVDMKGGLAVMLAIAERVTASARHDVTVCFYEGEEIEEEANGLRRLFAECPPLVTGDLAVLLEPTGGRVEAGCQGTLHARAVFRGARAHTARAWRGENAVHKAAPLLARLAAFEPAEIDVDGLGYREALQVVEVRGGVARNVVPDECVVVVNRRYAPSRPLEVALAELRALLVDADDVEIVNASPAAAPNLGHPLLAELVGALGVEVGPKLGWTDVARFDAHGIPALNFGPGDSELAHTPGEVVSRQELDDCYERLAGFLAG